MSAAYTCAGSLVAFAAYCNVALPIPPRETPVEISDTITPITDAVAASFKPGHDVRNRRCREPQLDERRPPTGGVAVHQLERRCQGPTAGRAASRRLMGKNARNAASD